MSDTGRFMGRLVARRALSRIALVAVLILATALRLSLVQRQLSVDEAESAINALTILEHGYPTDRYLGLPIYENVLLTPTPHDEEYEFKDPSYSDKGIAVYHGWLPLYGIAAAFAVAGITPDHEDAGPPAVRHGVAEFTRRTVVPRIPSILFAALFLVGAHGLGHAVSGRDTAWTLFVAAALAHPFVWFGWQARYYSATLALTALCGWVIWRYLEHARWRGAAAAGIALVLLFHTHVLSFLILSALLLACAPIMMSSRRDLLKLSLTGAILVLGLVPWIYFTGFLGAAARFPSAWQVVAFPNDFVSWFATRKAFALVIASVFTLVVLSTSGYRAESRLMRAARMVRRPVYFAAAWFVIAYLGFMLLIPAGSFYIERLTLVLAVPGYLLLALSMSVAGRTVAPRASVLLSPLLILAFLGTRGTVHFQFYQQSAQSSMQMFAELASRWTLAPGTRLYAFPNSHLPLTYYLGLPVQSIAPVRASFLDHYPGDVILLETAVPYSSLADDEVRAIGAAVGTDLSAAEVRQLDLRIQREGARRYLKDRVAAVWPPPEPLTGLERDILERTRATTRRRGEQMAAEFPLFRGFAPSLMYHSQWAPVHYWFINPAARIGDHANYRRRIAEGTAIVLPNGSIVFDARRNRDIPLVDRDTYDALRDIALREAQ